MTQDRCDIHIRGGVLVNSKELQLADVFIRDGVVDSIERPESGRRRAGHRGQGKVRAPRDRRGAPSPGVRRPAWTRCRSRRSTEGSRPSYPTSAPSRRGAWKEISGMR